MLEYDSSSSMRLVWHGVVFTNWKYTHVTNFVFLALPDGWKPV